MSIERQAHGRIVRAMHGRQAAPRDLDFEAGLDAFLRQAYSREGLIELYGRFCTGDGTIDALMRRGIWRTLAGGSASARRAGSTPAFGNAAPFSLAGGASIGSQAATRGLSTGI